MVLLYIINHYNFHSYGYKLINLAVLFCLINKYIIIKNVKKNDLIKTIG